MNKSDWFVDCINSRKHIGTFHPFPSKSCECDQTCTVMFVISYGTPKHENDYCDVMCSRSPSNCKKNGYLWFLRRREECMCSKCNEQSSNMYRPTACRRIISVRAYQTCDPEQYVETHSTLQLPITDVDQIELPANSYLVGVETENSTTGEIRKARVYYSISNATPVYVEDDVHKIEPSPYSASEVPEFPSCPASSDLESNHHDTYFVIISLLICMIAIYFYFVITARRTKKTKLKRN